MTNPHDPTLDDDERRLVASVLRALARDRERALHLVTTALDTARVNTPDALRALAARYAPEDPAAPVVPFDVPRARPEAPRPPVRPGGLSVDVYDLDGYPVHDDDEPEAW